jgi:transcriptional regulator of acetoin/glycerol metabolism
VDVRIMCATHRELAAHVASGRFREDLYYRLKVFTLSLPPLRERKADIIPLARIFLEQQGHPEMTFGPAARAALLAHRWPGNIRELNAATTHAAVLSKAAVIEPAALPDDVLDPAVTSPAPSGAVMRTLADVEREHILRVLEGSGGRHHDAARVLGIGRTTLWRKLREYGIDVD